MWLNCGIRADTTKQCATENGTTRPTRDSRQIRSCSHSCIDHPSFVSVVRGTHRRFVHVDDNMIQVSEPTSKQPLCPAQIYHDLVAVVTTRHTRKSYVSCRDEKEVITFQTFTSSRNSSVSRSNNRENLATCGTFVKSLLNFECTKLKSPFTSKTNAETFPGIHFVS
jgi:hypothetical protein